ncbi:TPA: DNA methyltransferase, partial [Streptococcus suis]
DYSNLYRNGKCLSYKKNWQEKRYSQEDVINSFFRFIKEIIVDDIKEQPSNTFSNNPLLYRGDSRKLIFEKVANNSVDLIITSPPYLNSRDYTDSYMLELKALDFFKNYNDIKELRAQTIRSHVQLKISNLDNVNSPLLKITLDKLEVASKTISSWNEEILNMILAYFEDMQIIFEGMYQKLKNSRRVYFNVSNSAYFGVLINTLEICAEIAENIGFKVIEIRKARYINPSPQQKEKIGKLLEGVLVLEK